MNLFNARFAAYVQAVRGRGTGLNPANRFEPYSLHVLPETLDEGRGEQPAGGVRLSTRVYVDASRTVLNRGPGFPLDPEPVQGL